MQNFHQTVPSAPIPTITHNKQFFTGLASLFSHAHAPNNALAGFMQPNDFYKYLI